jgi:hypothetical protein
MDPGALGMKIPVGGEVTDYIYDGPPEGDPKHCDLCAKRAAQ